MENSGIFRKLYKDFGLTMTQIGEISGFSKTSIIETLKGTDLGEVKKEHRIPSRPKFGEYINSKGIIKPLLGEQKIIQRMVKMRNNGDSFNQIAKWLRSAGITTKSGGKWHHRTVQETLKKGTNIMEEKNL